MIALIDLLADIVEQKSHVAFCFFPIFFSTDLNFFSPKDVLE